MAKRQELNVALRFVSSKVACEILGVTGQTLRRWAHKGQIGAIKTPGGQWRFDLSGLIIVPEPAAPPQPKPKKARAGVVPPSGKNPPAQLDLVEMVKAVPAPAVISAEALRGQIERLAKSSSW
jgi:excisionase family DNA binding protein